MDKSIRLAAFTDQTKYINWWLDEETTAHMVHGPWMSESNEAYVKKVINSNNLVAYEILWGEGHVGNCSLTINWERRSAELGIVLWKNRGLGIGTKAVKELGIVLWKNRGLGIGTKAVKELLSIGFNDLNLHRIWLGVFKSNENAIRCYRKCGFDIYGEEKEALWKEGKWVNRVLMEILNK